MSTRGPRTLVDDYAPAPQRESNLLSDLLPFLSLFSSTIIHQAEKAARRIYVNLVQTLSG
ncbi:hypothetical protein M404DRAFT_995764 [Pisolithus tinctorius Marx 270]|uniref:Uncharacterized protein n=1 Tax=Pisolithus tinctorius Marx 270 TaxID=870435 RepID=A0A0C3JMX0_PISTI|nr:hypothetical protein M404DRAFT_995764 [Pisolithus tinctorius Marx 270]